MKRPRKRAKSLRRGSMSAPRKQSSNCTGPTDTQTNNSLELKMELCHSPKNGSELTVSVTRYYLLDGLKRHEIVLLHRLLIPTTLMDVFIQSLTNPNPTTME